MNKIAMTKSVKCMLQMPQIYRFFQFLIAPGFKKAINNQIKDILNELPSGQRLLDVGCGPFSYLWWLNMKPIGVDISAAYTKDFRDHGENAVTASADNIPFSDNSFDGVWSFGLLHHLPDDTARRAVKEMMRVSRPGGYVVVFDAVLPEPSWHRPLAWLIRKYDRGRFMRRQAVLESILPDPSCWRRKRVVYSLNGLEGVYCIYISS